MDILTTFLGLWFGGIETNPLSDPYNITKLIKLHVPHIVIVLILAHFLGKWTPWAGNGVLLWMIMMGIQAFAGSSEDQLAELDFDYKGIEAAGYVDLSGEFPEPGEFAHHLNPIHPAHSSLF